MSRLTAADEYFYHQIPEPLTSVMVHDQHWRESLFFVAHPKSESGDVLVLTLAHFPAREIVDSLQMGRINSKLVMARHERAYDGDPHSFIVGPVAIEIVEPFKTMSLKVEGPDAPVTLDLVFEARTREHVLRRGTMRRKSETIWDQSHMIQSGTYNGTYTQAGITHEVDDWWGQRDHSWGIRNHGRCPLWMWLAIQLPDGTLCVWNWEYANGARVYTDGCFAPADMSEPIKLTGFEHDLRWLDAADREISYERDGREVSGICGEIKIRLENGQAFSVSGQGQWSSRYGELGGGQTHMLVKTDDGREGSGVYELPGVHHHRYFPISRGENLPDGQ